MKNKENEEDYLENMVEENLIRWGTPVGVPEVLSEGSMDQIEEECSELYKLKDSLLWAGKYAKKFLNAIEDPGEALNPDRTFYQFIADRIINLQAIGKRNSDKQGKLKDQELNNKIIFTIAFWEVIGMVIHLHSHKRYSQDEEFEKALLNPHFETLADNNINSDQIRSTCARIVAKLRLWAVEFLLNKDDRMFNYKDFCQDRDE